MRVYLAGSFNERERLRRLCRFMSQRGIEVTSSWLEEPELRNDTPAAEDWDLRARANDDWNDIARAEAFIIFTTQPSTTGGRDVELGRALTLGIPTLLIGPRENVFFRRREVYGYAEIRTYGHPILGPLATTIEDFERTERIEHLIDTNTDASGAPVTQGPASEG